MSVHMLLPMDGMPSGKPQSQKHMATCMAHNSGHPSQCHDGTSTCSSLDELLQDDGQQSMVDLAALIAKHRE
jgi:hypothetical protein